MSPDPYSAAGHVAHAKSLKTGYDFEAEIEPRRASGPRMSRHPGPRVSPAAKFVVAAVLFEPPLFPPREADNRIGYFLTVLKDWGRDHNDKTIFRRYINRWNLKKSDPKADVSDVDPETQIVFYIEKTVPVQ